MRCLFAISLKALKPKPKGYPNEIKTLGDHIKKKRMDLGWLQGKTAGEIGVDETTLCNWETQRAEPAISHLPKIIGFLGYTPYSVPRSFGEWLTQCRRSRGLSQEALATAIYKDESTIAKWEREDSHPTPESVKKIRNFFLTR